MTNRKLIFYIFVLALALVAGCQKSQPPSRHVTISMKKYAIMPAEIRLKAGETVQFEVVSEDVQHGFTVPDLGISEPVNPGKSTVFTFTANRKGMFGVECGIICGSGHDDMRARLIIE